MLRNILDKIQKQLFYFSAVVVFFLFFFMTVWGENGILRLIELRGVMEEINAENNALLHENLVHSLEIQKLKSDPAYIEQQLRSRLGFVKTKEIVFHVSED